MEPLAVSLLGLIAYTYAGYPAAAALLGRFRSFRPRVDPAFTPKVSICLSVYDGAPYLENKLGDLANLDYPHDQLEILVYSDGSADDTAAIVRRFRERDPRVRLIESAERHGKPTGINALRRAATGEVLFMTDVRPRVDRGALRALVSRLADSRVACVSGNLVLEGATGAGAYWRYEKFIRSQESRRGRMVGVSGTVYAIRRRDVVELPSDIVLDDMYVPLRAALDGRRKIVLATDARVFEAALDDGREFGRKARTLAGNYQLVAKLPALLSPFKNPLWFELFSHKLSRLACPFALVGLLFTSAVLGVSDHEHASFWALLTALQLVAYGLAILGDLAGPAGRLARTFVVLNAAAVVGLARFVQGRQPVTWQTEAQGSPASETPPNA